MEIGTRVFTLRNTTAKIVNMYGYGEYKGAKVPDDEDIKLAPEIVKPMLKLLKEANVANPIIVLDDGTHVWGCSCWFAAENSVKAKQYFEGREICFVKYGEE